MTSLRIALFAAISFAACRAPEPAPVVSAPIVAAPQEKTRIEFGVLPPETESYGEIVVPALDRAKREGKLVLLYFDSQISMTCAAFRADVLDDPSVAAWIGERLVLVTVDMNWHDGVVEKYGVGASNSLILVSTDGEKLAWIPHCRPPSAFIAALNEALSAR